MNYRLNVYEISSIKIYEKCIKTPRVVSMYCTGSSPRFWIWLSFFECFGILSDSLIAIFWVLSSKYFGFGAAEERSLLGMCIYSISKFPLLYHTLGTYYLGNLMLQTYWHYRNFVLSHHFFFQNGRHVAKISTLSDFNENCYLGVN